MFKVIKKEQNKRSTIKMRDMQPLEVATLESDPEIMVMRTASSIRFEVINLSKHSIDGCWTTPNNLKVVLLPKGESIIIELFN